VSGPRASTLAGGGLLLSLAAGIVLAVDWLVAIPDPIGNAALAVIGAGAVVVAVAVFRSARQQRVPVVRALRDAMRMAVRWLRELLF
jgi:uncharacterized membrane protein